MPSPYKTDCFDYNKIECKSRQNCIDKCHRNYILNYCNSSIPFFAIVDNHDNKNKFTNDIKCYKPQFCEEKYKWPECINEYYTIKPVAATKFKKIWSNKQIDTFIKYFTKRNNFNLSTDDIDSIWYIDIITLTPDTIYHHLAQQPPVEFICFIGGVIKLWTGFSVHSIYAYGKQMFSKKQNKIEPSKRVNYKTPNKKLSFPNKNNNVKKSLESKLNKMMKVMKTLKKNQVTHIHIA